MPLNEAEPAPLSDADFEQHLQSLLNEGMDHIDQRIRGARENAWKRYYGNVDAKPVNGGCDIVVRSIQDSIGSIVPDLLEIFTSADAVGEFLPNTHEEFEGQLCKSANLAAASVFWDCGGWLATHDAVIEASISGYGFYKVFKAEKYTKNYRTSSLDEVDLAMMGQAGMPVEPAWDTAAKNPQSQPNFGIYNYVETTKIENPVIEAVPASNMIWTYAPKFEDAWLIGQVTEVRMGTLIEMGFEQEELKNVTSKDTLIQRIRSEEDQRENFTASGSAKARYSDTSGSWAAKKVAYYELYAKVDRNGDGMPEAYKVWMAGDGKNLIRYQEIDWREMPFILVPGYRIPHSTYSEGVADRVNEFQEAETRMLRAEIDLAEMISGPMILNALGGGVDTNKLANWKAFKIIDCRATESVKMLLPPDVGASLLQMAQELKMRREDRSGVSRIASSLRPEDMADVQATVAREARASSEKKILYLARLQAELALKALMAKILDILVQLGTITVYHQNQAININTQNFDPKWKFRVKVGLGTGTRVERSATMFNLWQALSQVCMQMGPDNPLTSVAHLNNLIYDYGCMQPGMNVSRYIKPHQQSEQELQAKAQQPPPPDPRMEKVRADAETQKMKLQMNAQNQQMKLQMQVINNKAKISLRAQEAAQKLIAENQQAQAKLAAEYDLKMKELLGEYQLEEQRVADDKEIAMIKAENKIEVQRQQSRKLQ